MVKIILNINNYNKRIYNNRGMKFKGILFLYYDLIYLIIIRINKRKILIKKIKIRIIFMYFCKIRSYY